MQAACCMGTSLWAWHACLFPMSRVLVLGQPVALLQHACTMGDGRIALPGHTRTYAEMGASKHLMIGVSCPCT